jgi:hypothetical protein
MEINKKMMLVETVHIELKGVERSWLYDIVLNADLDGMPLEVKEFVNELKHKLGG